MLEKIESIIAKIFGAKNPLSRSTVLSSIPSWDSLNALLLISEIEQAFGVTFSDQEILSIKTIGDIEDCIRKKKS
ncbi:MAG: acyl carrier protein [Candidatus Diapherotrites archaeon]|uniref:Acyl carrier protein n=1 Tax=Candidatus Iainarchaeum sp. TaxID=3101447 RepID=A0A8T4L3K8_9ARCH|nr:acyl carrier protein [Candidatus Diapherotrites archaeon]